MCDFFKRNWKSLIIGLVVPYVAVLLGVTFLGPSHAMLAGIPLSYLWIFLWFILTSVCLAISWHYFDQFEFPDD